MTSPHPDVEPNFGFAKLVAVTVVTAVWFSATFMEDTSPPPLEVMTGGSGKSVTVMVTFCEEEAVPSETDTVNS